jgi:hypothetical protein
VSLPLSCLSLFASLNSCCATRFNSNDIQTGTYGIFQSD